MPPDKSVVEASDDRCAVAGMPRLAGAEYVGPYSWRGPPIAVASKRRVTRMRRARSIACRAAWFCGIPVDIWLDCCAPPPREAADPHEGDLLRELLSGLGVEICKGVAPLLPQQGFGAVEAVGRADGEVLVDEGSRRRRSGR